MFKVSGSVLGKDSEILEDADVMVLGSTLATAKTTTDEDGRFALTVDSPSTVLSVGKMGYVTQVITAKDLNDFGIVYLDYGITVRTKPKNNNMLLAIVAAAFITTAVVVYRKNRAKPIKIK